MQTSQIVFGSALVLIIFGLALWFAWRQGVALRRLRLREDEITAAERKHHRGQITRRLVSSALLGILAVLLAGALIFLEGPTQKIVDRGGVNEADLEVFKAYGQFWASFLLVLLGLLVLAGMDFWTNRRFGLRKLRQLQAERRAMIERESDLLRQRKREGS